MGDVVPQVLQTINHLWKRRLGRVGSGGIGVKSSAPDLLEKRFGHNRARRILRAQEQDVEGRRNNIRPGLGGWRGRHHWKMAAELGFPTAAIVGEKVNQAAKAGDVGAVADCSAV